MAGIKIPGVTKLEELFSGMAPDLSGTHLWAKGGGKAGSRLIGSSLEFSGVSAVPLLNIKTWFTTRQLGRF